MLHNTIVTQSASSDVSTSLLSDAQDILSEGSIDSDWCFEDDVVSSDFCICGAGSRAHKKDCPMSSRNRYLGSILFPKQPSSESVPPHSDKACMSNDLGSLNALGKREMPKRVSPPPAKV